MRVETRLFLLAVVASTALVGCADPGPAPLVGTLEWDRVAVTAELAEPVLALARRRRRPRRSRHRAARAGCAASGRADHRGREPARYSRSEACRARTRRAHRDNRCGARESRAGARGANDAESEYKRVAELQDAQLVAASAVDQALAARNQRRAETQAAEAQLRELTQGTRPEQIEQAAAAVAAAQRWARRR